MPIVLDQSTNPDRFTARHWMFMPIERVTEPGLHAEESFTQTRSVILPFWPIP